MTDQPLLPVGGNNERALALLREAKAFNARMDAVDGGEYFHPLSSQLRTALLAIFAGLNRGDWDSIAQATLLVMQVEVVLRQLDGRDIIQHKKVDIEIPE